MKSNLRCWNACPPYCIPSRENDGLTRHASYHWLMKVSILAVKAWFLSSFSLSGDMMVFEHWKNVSIKNNCYKKGTLQQLAGASKYIEMYLTIFLTVVYSFAEKSPHCSVIISNTRSNFQKVFLCYYWK